MLIPARDVIKPAGLRAKFARSISFQNGYIQSGTCFRCIISPGISCDFLPEGFTLAFDQNNATNRNVDKPYTKGKTPTTVIDFFMLSPNVKLISANTVQNNFEFVDHQPLGIEAESK